MPSASEKEYEPQITRGDPRTAPIAAQWDIDIVTEPCRKRDVPAPPEILHRRGAIGIIEILGETKTEDARQTYRHVRIAGEVEIDLQSVAEGTEPRRARGELIRRNPEDLIDDGADWVGDHELLHQPDGEAPMPASTSSKRAARNGS